jgi:hypothetical protein
MDRELLDEQVGFPAERGMGIAQLMDRIRVELPRARLASYTRYVGPARRESRAWDLEPSTSLDMVEAAAR